MKIAIVYGTMHKGSTYRHVQMILSQLSSVQSLSVTEFYLPKDMPNFCTSCFSCFLNGEQTCPHYKSVKTIADALEQADLIILESPTYVYDVSGQMKALLDHLGFQWIVHRPRPSMFSKIGLVVSTAAGGGTSSTCKTMKNSLTYWGVSRIFSFKSNVKAIDWNDVNPTKKEAIAKQAEKIGRKIEAAYKKSRKPTPRLFIKILFYVSRQIQKSRSADSADRVYWQQQGWLDGKKPW